MKRFEVRNFKIFILHTYPFKPYECFRNYNKLKSNRYVSNDTLPPGTNVIMKWLQIFENIFAEPVMIERRYPVFLTVLFGFFLLDIRMLISLAAPLTKSGAKRVSKIT